MTVSSIRAPRAVISPDIIARLTQIVGANNAITDPAEQEGYLVEERGLYHGHTPLVLRPGSTSPKWLRSSALPTRPRRRSCRRAATPGWSAAKIAARRRSPVLAPAAQPHSRGRCRRRTHDVRSRRRARQGAGGGRRRRSAVSALARRRRQLHHRRQSLDQRRRHQRTRLWRRARSRARSRSGASGRPDLGMGSTSSRRTTPATTSSSCSSARRARSASLRPPY